MAVVALAAGVAAGVFLAARDGGDGTDAGATDALALRTDATPSTAESATGTAAGDGPPTVSVAVADQTDEPSTSATEGTATGEASSSTTDAPTTTEASTSSSIDTSTTQEPTTEPSTTASSAPPAAGERFVTLPPGSALPTSAECAARVRPTPETVPENEPYNSTRGRAVTGTYLSINTAIAANDYEQRLDGAFTGTTDEVIQWAACKWGFDEDIVRAQVYTESSWYAGKLGDCGEQTHERTGGAGGCASVGLIQVRSAETGFTHHPGVYPIALDSSAMNLDYGLAVMRLCFEGQESWLAQVAETPGGYQAGDHWNCMGRWFSGSFGDSGAQAYIGRVQDNLANRYWERPAGRGCPNWQESFHCSGISR